MSWSEPRRGTNGSSCDGSSQNMDLISRRPDKNQNHPVDKRRTSRARASTTPRERVRVPETMMSVHANASARPSTAPRLLARRSDSALGPSPLARFAPSSRVGRDVAPPPRAVASSAGEMELVPPASREDSFEQAREAIASVCAKRAKKAGKRRKSTGKALAPLRVAVELPLASDAPAAVCAMVDGACGGGVVGTAVYGDDAAATRGKTEGDARLEHVTLAQALAGEGCDLAAGEGAVALVGVAEEQIAAAKRVADLAGGRPIVGVNVEWEHAGDGGVTFRQRAEPAADAVEIFANSFSVVYSYLPLSIQGLVGTAQEGAVFKCVRGGAPEGSPWRILVKDEGEAYQQVGAMQRRPQQEDLEAALYNAAAAKSPVNKSIGAFRGLAEKAKASIPNPFAGKDDK